MDNSDIAVLETLLSTNPNLRTIYDLLGLPPLGPNKHPDKNNIVSCFGEGDKSSVGCILIIGVLTWCFFVKRKSKTKFEYICIDGNSVTSEPITSNMNSLVDTMYSLLNLDEPIPEPLTKKIVLIDNVNKGKIYGKMFYHYKGKHNYIDMTDGSTDIEDIFCGAFENEDKSIAGWNVLKDYLKYLPCK